MTQTTAKLLHSEKQNKPIHNKKKMRCIIDCMEAHLHHSIKNKKGSF